MKKAEARLAGLSVKVNQANWVHANFITDDTEALAAAVNEENTAVTAELVEQAKRFDGLKMPADLSRKFLLLKLLLTAPAPHDPAAAQGDDRDLRVARVGLWQGQSLPHGWQVSRHYCTAIPVS